MYHQCMLATPSLLLALQLMLFDIQIQQWYFLLFVVLRVDFQSSRSWCEKDTALVDLALTVEVFFLGFSTLCVCEIVEIITIVMLFYIG